VAQGCGSWWGALCGVQGITWPSARRLARRLGMGTNMYPSSALLGQHPDPDVMGMDVDELIEQADGFAGVFPGEPSLPPLPSLGSPDFCWPCLEACDRVLRGSASKKTGAEADASALVGPALLGVLCGGLW